MNTMGWFWKRANTHFEDEPASKVDTSHLLLTVRESPTQNGTSSGEADHDTQKSAQPSRTDHLLQRNARDVWNEESKRREVVGEFGKLSCQPKHP